MSTDRNKKIMNALIILLLVIVSWMIYRYLPHERLRAWIDGLGVYGPLFYILLFTLLPVFFFPVPVLALTGGVSFGLLYGSLYTIIGAMLNCSLMFLMSRYFAKAQFKEFTEKRISRNWRERLYGADSKMAFVLIFILRLIPLVPYNIINYVCGLTEMSFRSYFMATLIGIIPGTVVFINLGDKSVTRDPKQMVLSVLFLFLLIGLSVIIAKYMKKQEKI